MKDRRHTGVVLPPLPLNIQCLTSRSLPSALSDLSQMERVVVEPELVYLCGMERTTHSAGKVEREQNNGTSFHLKGSQRQGVKMFLHWWYRYRHFSSLKECVGFSFSTIWMLNLSCSTRHGSSFGSFGLFQWHFDCRVSPFPSHVALVWVHTFHLSIQGDGGGAAVEPFSPLSPLYLPSSSFISPPPPGEDCYLSRISKCAWMLNGILEKRYEGTDRRGRQFVLLVDMLPRTWIHTDKPHFVFFFCCREH